MQITDTAYRRIIISTLILAGILLYLNTLTFSSFLFDGELFLLNNPLYKNLDFYRKLLDINEFSRLDEQLGLHQDVTTNFMMRPVAYLTFSINYLLGGMNAAAFRSVNIAIHIFNALLVFCCSELLLSIPASCRSLSRFSLRFIPAATASVFLLHPMQTESVTYITQRFASLGALFYLTTIWLYLLWLRKEQQGRRLAWLRWASVVALLLGMFTRESLFTAPFMLVLLETTLLGSPLRAGLKRAAPHLLLLPVIPLMTIMMSAAQNDSPAAVTLAINAVNYDDVPVAHYAMSQLVVVLSYLKLYLFPHGQNVDPDPDLYTNFLELPVIGAALAILLLVGSAYLLFRKNREDVRCRLIFAGTCWYFLALAVSSSFIPLPDLMAEHRAYLASAGFLLALISLLDILRTRLGTMRSSKMIVTGITAWCIVLSMLTVKRNNVWHSGIDLWRDAVRKSPEKDRPWYNLGTSYLKEGDYPEAQLCFRKALELNPLSSKGHEMLAVTHLQLKQYEDVIKVSLKGIRLDPANPVLYNNLGIAYAELHRENEARQAFTKALALLPSYEKARINLDKLESYIESKVSRQSPAARPTPRESAPRRQ